MSQQSHDVKELLERSIAKTYFNDFGTVSDYNGKMVDLGTMALIERCIPKKYVNEFGRVIDYNGKTVDLGTIASDLHILYPLEVQYSVMVHKFFIVEAP